MKNLLANSFLLAGLLLMPLASCKNETQKASFEPGDKPNIILIFTDDQGYGDLGCYGSPTILTPNIDKLASEGIRMTSFYAAPFCGPSRAQIMTGCYPPRVSHAMNHGPGATRGLHPNEITIAEVLKTQDYSTMIIGKWHLGDAPQFLPTSQGFDRFFGIPYSNDMWKYHPKMPPRENEDERMKAARERAAYTGYAGQESYYPEGGGFPNDLPLMRDTEVIEKNPDLRQLTTRYTEEAIQFITQNQGQPFFLYMAHAMPHVPLFVSEKYAGRSERDLYGDVMMEVDWSTGEIMKTLASLGLDERTLVVFTSDNGPWLQYGMDGGSAGPLHGGKGSLWEGGVRVPAIMRWPGQIPAGRRSSEIAGNMDLLPTFAHVAGTSAPSDRIIDGRDLWPLLSGETEKGPHDTFCYYAAGREGHANLQAIREGRWKLFVSLEDGTVKARELYDLGGDLSETRNRIADHPDIAERLEKMAAEAHQEILKNQRPLGHID